MLVKLMNPTLHPHKIATYLFENEGRELIKGLQSYKHKNDATCDAADEMISLINFYMP